MRPGAAGHRPAGRAGAGPAAAGNAGVRAGQAPFVAFLDAHSVPDIPAGRLLVPGISRRRGPAGTATNASCSTASAWPCLAAGASRDSVAGAIVATYRVPAVTATSDLDDLVDEPLPVRLLEVVP